MGHSITAPFARGRSGMRDKDHIVAVLARELFHPGLGAVFDLLTPPLTNCITTVDDICRNLRDISGVFPQGRLNDRDTFAHELQQNNVLVVLVLVGFATTCMVAISLGSGIG